MNILTINLALSTLVFWIAAKLYVLPKLQDYEAEQSYCQSCCSTPCGTSA